MLLHNRVSITRCDFYYFSILAHGCDVISMSLVGSPMTLTHLILINLFITLELNNFLLPPLLSKFLLKSVQSSSGNFLMGRDYKGIHCCQENGQPRYQFVKRITQLFWFYTFFSEICCF